MSIVQTDVPMTPGLCEKSIRILMESYPFLRERVLTTTAFGRPVQLLTFGDGERRVILSAAHHANEWITATLLLKFIEELANAYAAGGSIGTVHAPELWSRTTLLLLPMVDPDGAALVTGAASEEETAAARTIADRFPAIPFPSGWKANLKGVDLNLQYPAGWMTAREIKFSQGYDRPAPRDYVGRAPLDQRESRALAALTDEVEADLVLALHTQGEVIYWQFRDYQVPGAKALGEEFARLSGYTLADTPYESSFAGYKDWFIQRFRRPGFTIECGLGENPLPIDQFDEIYPKVLPILTAAAWGLAF